MMSARSKSALLDEVLRYYKKRESRWGYKFLLGGTRHFGYYPEGSRWLTMRTAQRHMEDLLGESLALPPQSSVLDAGCGEGSVAVRLAQRFGLFVTGIDILPESIEIARAKARQRNLEHVVSFEEMDYAHLELEDASLDGAYTMETLVHAGDFKKVLAELRRVLRPGGKLVLIEYSIAPPGELDAEARRHLDGVTRRAAMHSLPYFIHGRFPALLEDAGFADVNVVDITEHITPMLRRFAQIGFLPYALIRLLNAEERFVNVRSAVEGYRYRRFVRYNVVTASRP